MIIYQKRKMSMKIFLVFILSVLILSCSSTKETESNSGSLNGSWQPIMEEMDGQELPQNSFEGHRLAIADSVFLFVAEGVDEGIIKYDNGKMDIYVQDGVNRGKHFPAIYKLESGLLTICYNLTGDKYPAAFETTSNPNYLLTVFRKE
jgi:uncharacterized protein (TIGR03067 family)